MGLPTCRITTCRRQSVRIFQQNSMRSRFFLFWGYFGLHYFGLVGAAWAWTLRVTIDAMLMFAVTGQASGLRRVLPGGMLMLVAALLSPTVLLSMKAACECIVVIVSVIWSWRLDPVTKATLKTVASRLRVMRSQKTQLLRTGVSS
jgi:hypothetical protein